ncbi:GDSL-like Lipase/Acylhydrolase family protein [Friedmanniella luteola]|uniref:GDSL-like Lipase/Acylhydrolase family protein n=1 Tax=Friedmanniella luteola TaxID=546871 RepID=A0A1H1ML68_9ACTN|nr:GDSL-type esterase/lipase family protein [Friedmanniella luteola]SDR87362.1 GDSL-like Lipase/Acylhydrolase family protein [Friedmanniella luteola]
MRTRSLLTCLLVVVVLLTAGSCRSGAGAPAPSATRTVGVLDQWRAALAGRASEPAVWYSIGESLAEGQGASTVESRWFTQVSDALHAADPGGGRADYVPARQRVYGPDSPWGNRYSASEGTLVMRDGSAEAGYGFADLGHKALEMAPGASLTFSVTGTSVDLCWVGAPLAGTFSYTVDGGPPVSVSTTTETPAPASRTRATFATGGDHTVVVTAASDVVFAGLMVYDGGETSGITTVDGAWSSATLAVPFLTDLEGWRQTTSTLAPDLVTIELGGNDVLQGTDPATFRQQAQSLVDMLMSLPTPPSIYWVFPYQFSPTLDNADQMGTYQDQIAQLVAANPSVGLLSLRDQMPAATAAGGGLYASDGLHPNDAGQRVIAGLVGAVVTAPLAGTASPSPSPSPTR